MNQKIAPAFLLATLALLLITLPTTAAAQYKNSSFAIDAGVQMITTPAVVDGSGAALPIDERPLRLDGGLRVGGETNIKMASDSWWFVGRLNLGAMRFAGDSADIVTERFDAEAHDRLGYLLGVQSEIAIRHFFLTDRHRPYLQAGVSYLRLITLTGSASSPCQTELICAGDGSTYADNLLPHPNVGALHLQAGFEWIYQRDQALHVFVDFQRWLIIGPADNNSVVLGLGFDFYT